MGAIVGLPSSVSGEGFVLIYFLFLESEVELGPCRRRCLVELSGDWSITTIIPRLSRLSAYIGGPIIILIPFFVLGDFVVHT